MRLSTLILLPLAATASAAAVAVPDDAQSLPSIHMPEGARLAMKEYFPKSLSWPEHWWNDIRWLYDHPLWRSTWWRRLFHESPRYRPRPSNSTTPGNSTSPSNSNFPNSTAPGNSSLPSGPCTNTATSRGCWTEGFNISTDMYKSWPETGVTRAYSFEVTNTTIAPDGVQRQGFMVNGQYPGPTIYADWGDYVEVTVTNSMQDNGTTMHWHGMRQWYSVGQDGTPGVTECPLAPGHTKTYRWQATQYGTAWYHSHFNVQYGDGVVGTIVINGPSTANYDIDLGPMPFTDWYYETASTRSYIIAHTGGRPPTTADTGLINGTMVSQVGTGSYAMTSITKGKKYKLRLINTSVDNSFAVSLDNHQLTVIAADLTPIEPFTADWIFVTIGQRYDVVIDADQPVGNYWFRAEVQDQPFPPCGRNTNNGNIKSIFRYEGASAVDPTSVATAYTQSCSGPGVTPYLSEDVPSETLIKGGELDSSIQIGVNTLDQTVVKWGLDVTPLFVDWNKPTLEYVYEGNSSFPKAANVLTLPGEGSWVYWIIQEVPGTPITISIPHPIHLHGHDFFILGSGTGDFSSTGGSTLQYKNPPRRDTAMLPAGGWLVVAFEVDNPGAWLMHCHIAWHSDEGMGVQFLELEDQIAAPVSSYSETCSGWNDYWPENAAYSRDGDDSGV